MIGPLLALMLGAMLAGIPVLLAIALAGYVGVAAEPDVVLPLFAQKVLAQLDSSTLLALPYFILAGSLMSAGGMGRRLVELSRGTLGAMIPPGLTMVIYGAIAPVSLGGLLLAGMLPGVLVGLLLMAATRIRSDPLHPSGFEWGGLGQARAGAWPALLGPAIVVGGLLSGVLSATEAGVVACLYALGVGLFVHRGLCWRELPRILVESAVMTTVVSGVIAVAGAASWLLGYLQFNESLAGLVGALTQSPMVVLLVLSAVTIVLGRVVDPLAVLLVVAPVAIEIGRKYGIDPFQLGLVMVMCNQIGAVPPAAARRHGLAQVTVLGLVIVFPGLTTWIPHQVLG